MASATDIVGYTWQADEFCPPCIAKMFPYQGATAEDILSNGADWEGVDRNDESTFDSASMGDYGEPNDLVFPKVIFRDHLDSQTRHCGGCHEVLGDTLTGTDLLPGRKA